MGRGWYWISLSEKLKIEELSLGVGFCSFLPVKFWLQNKFIKSTAHVTAMCGFLFFSRFFSNWPIPEYLNVDFTYLVLSLSG